MSNPPTLPNTPTLKDLVAKMPGGIDTYSKLKATPPDAAAVETMIDTFSPTAPAGTRGLTMTNTQLGAQSLFIAGGGTINTFSVPTSHLLGKTYNYIGSLDDRLSNVHPASVPHSLADQFICTLVPKADAVALKLPITDPGPDNFARVDGPGGPDPTRFPGFTTATSLDEYPVLVAIPVVCMTTYGSKYPIGVKATDAVLAETTPYIKVWIKAVSWVMVHNNGKSLHTNNNYFDFATEFGGNHPFPGVQLVEEINVTNCIKHFLPCSQEYRTLETILHFQKNSVTLKFFGEKAAPTPQGDTLHTPNSSMNQQDWAAMTDVLAKAVSASPGKSMKDQEEEANRNEVVQFYQALFAYESKVVLEDGREQSIATPAVLDATFTDLSKKSKVNRLKYFRNEYQTVRSDLAESVEGSLCNFNEGAFDNPLVNAILNGSWSATTPTSDVEDHKGQVTLFAFGTPNVTSAGYIERQCANQRLFRETVATGEERTRTKRATEIATDGKFGNLGDSQSVFYSFYHLMTGYLQDFPENKEKATPFIWRALVAIVMACKNPKVVIWAQRMASLWPWLAFAIVLEGQAILASAVEIASNSKVVGAMRSNKQVDATAYLNLVHRGLTLAQNLVTMSTTGTSAFFSTEPICFVLFADRKRVMKKHIEAESTAETAKQYTPTKPKQDSGKPHPEQRWNDSQTVQEAKV